MRNPKRTESEMNTVTAHTSESLNSLSRKALIAVAVELSIEKPHNTKSADLVEKILAAQPAPAVDEQPVEAAVADNVVAFPGTEAQQTEIPAVSAPAAAPVSHGIFKVNRKTFQRQLAAAAKIAGASKTMPVLSCVLLDFQSGVLAVEANDLSNHLRTEATAETTGAHRVAIPHGVLSKFVARCSSEFLMAEAVGDKLVISDLENRTEIMGIPDSEWPANHPLAAEPVLTIAGKQLARVVAETLPFASTDETRYVLNGVALDLEHGVAVATDGRRLCRSGIGAESIASLKAVLIVPSHACSVLAASVPQDATVEVLTNAGRNVLHVCAQTVGFVYRLTARLVDANFPAYRGVIPDVAKFGGQFELNREELDAALGRLLVVANANGQGSAVKFELGESALVLNAVNTTVGEGKEQVSVRCESGAAPRLVAVNGEYFSAITRAWADDKLTVNINDEVSPIIVRAGDKLAVVMPVRLA